MPTCFLIRGTPYNQGSLLRRLISKGARQLGDPNQCHAVAIEARATRFDGGIITRLDCVVFGIVVNRDAQRFHDDGEDICAKRYAIWGRLIAAQPGQIAWIVFDARSPSQVEAMTLADKIVVLRAGEVMQVGSPRDLYHNPENQFVAGFLGSPKMNLFDVEVKEAANGRGTVMEAFREIRAPTSLPDVRPKVVAPPGPDASQRRPGV